MKKTVIGAICAFLAVAALLSVFGREYSRTEYMLDTVITITAKNKTAVDACFDEIRRLERLFSPYISDSDVWRINHSSVGEETVVSAEAFALIEKAEVCKRLTDGSFDISLKPVSDLWDVENGGYVPSDEEIQEALSLKGDLLLNKDCSAVTLTKDGMQIDLGGIAKGYIGDRVREILLSHGVKSAIADLGGNIVTVGENGGKPWKIGLQKPNGAKGESFTSVCAVDKTVVTSGGYERYFECDGKTYHHIFDPVTGKNPHNGIASVTIIASDGALADALSTACFIKGKDGALVLAEKCNVDAVVYMEDGTFFTTPNLEIQGE